MKYFSTRKILPEYLKYVLVWYPLMQMWLVGSMHFDPTAEHSDYFKIQGYGGWYIQDGHTFWMPLPPKPEEIA